jgi:hypothetical protein
MKARNLAVGALLALLPLVLPAIAQQPTPDLRPRIGQISDEVALERLRMAGVENPRLLRREGTEIIAQGYFQGRDATLRLDALRGRLVDPAVPSVVIAGPGATVARPVVTGPQLRQERSLLSEPALMREAIRPQP